MGNRALPVSGNISSVTTSALEDISNLRDDLEEAIDSMSERLSTTERFERFEEAGNIIDNMLLEIDIPDAISDIELVYSRDTRTRESSTKTGQRNNILNQLNAIISESQNWIDNEIEKQEEDEVEVEDFINNLQDICDELEALDLS